MTDEKDRRLTATTGRDPKTGRFVQGNRGRPPGALNKSSIDAQTLRARIVESWTRVEADEKLDQLAAEDFSTYLKVVASPLPKQTKAQIRTKDVRRMSTAELAEHVRQRRAGEPDALDLDSMNPDELARLEHVLNGGLSVRSAQPE